MDDPRLLEWLRVTEDAGDPIAAEAGERLEAARLRRAELQRGLESHPPGRAPSPELAQRLWAAEERLAARTAALKLELASSLEEVRRQRQATRGYRPPSVRRASFVSHDV
ncbi:MAG: hypothetical protein ACE5IL_00150 [Myxococcota bacterium]